MDAVEAVRNYRPVVLIKFESFEDLLLLFYFEEYMTSALCLKLEYLLVYILFEL